MKRSAKVSRGGAEGSERMADAGTAGGDRHVDPPPEERAEDEAPLRARCLACGEAIADVLLSLGAIDCHDCRAGRSYAA